MKNNNIIKNNLLHLFRSKSNKLYCFSIIISMLLLTLLYCTQEGIINHISKERKDIYGEFTDILYISKDSYIDASLAFESVLPDFQFSSLGCLYNTCQFFIENQRLILGYADETAIKLGHIKPIKGRFPKDNKEIAFTYGIYSSLFSNYKIGDTISLYSNSYKLVGIIEDYGSLWPKGQAELSYEIINTFVNEAEAPKFLDSNNLIKMQILVDRVLGVANSAENYAGFYKNFNLNYNEISTPLSFIILIYICSFLILYNILVLSKYTICQNLKIHYFLGLYESKCKRLFYIKFICITIIGSITGFILGICFSFFVLKLWGNFFESSVSLILDYKLFYLWLTLVVISSIALYLFYTIYCKPMYTIDKVDNSTKSFKHKKPRKFSNLYFVFLELKYSYSLQFIIIIIIFASLLLENVVIYRSFFIKENEYQEIEGKMPINFDFELWAAPTNADSVENSIFIVNSYENTGVPEDIVKQISEDSMFSSVSAYKEVNDLWILIEEEKIDKYLDASDFIIDNSYKNSYNNSPIFSLYGYNNCQNVNTKMVGYSDDELMKFSSYFSKGEIDLDKLKKGEEVILMAPCFQLSRDDNVITKDYVYPNQEIENAFCNTLFSVGDTITISKLLSYSKNNCNLTEDNALQLAYRKDATIKIAAIIPYLVGWWEREAGWDVTYHILTSNDAFDNIGFPANYNRITIYANDLFKHPFLLDRVNTYCAKLPSISVKDTYQELTDYRVLNFMINLFTIILVIITILSNFISIRSQLTNNAKLNTKKYALLRINGMSIKKLTRLLFYQTLFLGFISLLLSIPISCLYITLFYHIPFKYIEDFISIFDYILIIATQIIILIVSFIPTLKYINQSDIKSMFREST